MKFKKQSEDDLDSNYYNAAIIKELSKILDKLSGAKLYGKEIDMSNVEEVVVGAFYLGSRLELEKQAETNRMLKDLEIKWQMELQRV